MRKGIGRASNSATLRECERRGPRAFRKYFEVKRLERCRSSWKMHLLFTPRVLSSSEFWSKVRNVNGREDRSLESKDDRGYPRSFHVPAQPSPIQNPAGSSKNRGSGKEKFAECEDVRHTRIPHRTQDASPQPPQTTLQIAEAGRSDGPTKGLRSTPRRTPPKNEALTHHRGWRAIPAPASGP